MDKADKINIIRIPQFSSDVLSAFQASENPWVKIANQNISTLNELIAALPKNYRWRFRTVDALREEINDVLKTAKDAHPINQLSWSDHLGNCEAYSLMNTWRNVDLVRGCVWAIARDEIIAAALLARSSLETAAQFADTTRTISATLVGATAEDSKGRLLDPSIDFRKDFVISEDFERLLLKTLFASRLPGTEEFYQPTNVVTIINRVSKVQGQELVLGMYERLCEVAHPNLLGRSIYMLEQHPGKRFGDEIRVIGMGSGPSSREITEATLGAISWAAGTNVAAFRLMSQTIGAVFNRLKKA